MKEITAKKEDLLGILRANSEAHREMFLEAVEGYRVQAVARLKKEIVAIEKGSRIKIAIYMPVPEDHTEDYDRVIKMLEMHQSPMIEIGEHLFAQYVMDDWEWKADFLGTHTTYTSEGEIRST